jgi:hypothetical protein
MTGEPEKEGFGEATPGEAQAENPPSDDEMIDSPSEGEEGGGESGTPAEYEGGTETYGGDQDAEPAGADA